MFWSFSQAIALELISYCDMLFAGSAVTPTGSCPRGITHQSRYIWHLLTSNQVFLPSIANSWSSYDWWAPVCFGRWNHTWDSLPWSNIVFALWPHGSPFEGPGPHGDLIQFLGPHFCSKVPIFYIQAHERVKSPCSHYLMSIIRLFVITILALMNPMPACQWSRFCYRTMFSPILKALFQRLSLFRFGKHAPFGSPFCWRGSPFH